MRLLCVLAPDPMYYEIYLDWAGGYLAEASERATLGWDGALTTSIRTGRVTEEITAEAEAWKADVIVLATHGRGGLSRYWLGSVADRLIRTATRPVLAVPPA